MNTKNCNLSKLYQLQVPTTVAVVQEESQSHLRYCQVYEYLLQLQREVPEAFCLSTIRAKEKQTKRLAHLHNMSKDKYAHYYFCESGKDVRNYVTYRLTNNEEKKGIHIQVLEFGIEKTSNSEQVNYINESGAFLPQGQALAAVQLVRMTETYYVQGKAKSFIYPITHLDVYNQQPKQKVLTRCFSE